MKEKLTSVGAVVLSFLSRPCCVLPLVLSLLGLGSGSAVVFFVRYRYFLLILMGGSLSLSFYLNFRVKGGMLNKMVSVISALVAIGFQLFPYLR